MAEADERQKLGLGAAPEPVLFEDGGINKARYVCASNSVFKYLRQEYVRCSNERRLKPTRGSFSHVIPTPSNTDGNKQHHEAGKR